MIMGFFVWNNGQKISKQTLLLDAPSSIPPWQTDPSFGKTGDLVRKHKNLSGWWLNQPIWKICASQIGSFPQGSGWKYKKYLKTPPRKKHSFISNQLDTALVILQTSSGAEFTIFAEKHQHFSRLLPRMLHALGELGCLAIHLRMRIPRKLAVKIQPQRFGRWFLWNRHKIINI